MQSAANELVSTPNSLLTREINREFRRIRPSTAISASNQRANSRACSQIPYATEQGIFAAITGNFFGITGKFNPGETKAIVSALSLKRCQQPDVPLDLSFPPGDHGETGGAAMRQIVDPLAGLGDRDQEGLAAASFDRRVVRGHTDDALDGGGDRAGPGHGHRRDARDRAPC